MKHPHTVRACQHQKSPSFSVTATITGHQQNAFPAYVRMHNKNLSDVIDSKLVTIPVTTFYVDLGAIYSRRRNKNGAIRLLRFLKGCRDLGIDLHDDTAAAGNSCPIALVESYARDLLNEAD